MWEGENKNEKLMEREMREARREIGVIKERCSRYIIKEDKTGRYEI